MHCVLLGEHSSLFSRQLKRTTKIQRNEFDCRLTLIKAPRELVEHGRQPQPDAELSNLLFDGLAPASWGKARSASGHEQRTVRPGGGGDSDPAVFLA